MCKKEVQNWITICRAVALINRRLCHCQSTKKILLIKKLQEQLRRLWTQLGWLRKSLCTDTHTHIHSYTSNLYVREQSAAAAGHFLWLFRTSNLAMLHCVAALQIARGLQVIVTAPLLWIWIWIWLRLWHWLQLARSAGSRQLWWRSTSLNVHNGIAVICFRAEDLLSPCHFPAEKIGFMFRLPGDWVQPDANGTKSFSLSPCTHNNNNNDNQSHLHKDFCKIYCSQRGNCKTLRI